ILNGDVIIGVSNIRKARSTKSEGACCIFIASNQKETNAVFQFSSSLKLELGISLKLKSLNHLDSIILKKISFYHLQIKIISSININLGKTKDYIKVLCSINDDEVFTYAKKMRAPFELVAQTKRMGWLPLARFASSGIVTSIDVAKMMQSSCDRVSIGREVFEGLDTIKHVWAIVEASMLSDV
ncbi:Pyridoxal 5'-phosphate synthase-like subunit PDX1.2, partial [Bienertia sinuspersici]